MAVSPSIRPMRWMSTHWIAAFDKMNKPMLGICGVIKAISGGVKLEKAGDGRYALTVPAAEFAIVQY